MLSVLPGLNITLFIVFHALTRSYEDVLETLSKSLDKSLSSVPKVTYPEGNAITTVKNLFT